jgi:hypothetical protein
MFADAMRKTKEVKRTCKRKWRNNRNHDKISMLPPRRKNYYISQRNKICMWKWQDRKKIRFYMWIRTNHA